MKFKWSRIEFRTSVSNACLLACQPTIPVDSPSKTPCGTLSSSSAFHTKTARLYVNEGGPKPVVATKRPIDRPTQPGNLKHVIKDGARWLFVHVAQCVRCAFNSKNHRRPTTLSVNTIYPCTHIMYSNSNRTMHQWTRSVYVLRKCRTTQ